MFPKKVMVSPLPLKASMADRFRNFISRLEESRIGFELWIAAALSIIFMRDSLECLVTAGSFPIADLFHLFHVPIFFSSLLLTVILLLHFFSGEEITKVSKVSLIFFAIILLPVLMDFFISLAVKREVVYQYIEEDAGKNFIQFLNPFLRLSQVPFSLRIEVAGITLLSFIYIHLKKSKIFLSLIGAFFVFVSCVLYGAIPAVLTGLISSFFRFLIFLSKFIYLNIPPKLTGIVDERVVVITQLLFTSVLIAIWYSRYDGEKFRALWRNLRWARVFHYILLVMMGVALYFYDVRETDIFLVIKILGITLAMFFACQFCAVANDIFDTDCDRLSNKDRPLIAGTLEKYEYLRVGFVYLALALCFAVWVSDRCFMVILVFMALYFIYSAPPFRLKRFYPLNPLIIGIEAVLAFLLGQVSLAPTEFLVSFYPSILGLLFAIFFLSSHIKDLKDMEGDKSCQILTLPVMLGVDRGRLVTGGFVLLSYLLAPFLFYSVFTHWFIFVLALVFGTANFVYIRRRDAQERFIFGTYLVFGMTLLSFLIQAVFFS
ncbi:MAG: UbiA family prenyltransferase [Candidatus Omnitrophota bacterium]